MKMYEFRLRFHWSLFLRSKKQYSSIGSDNGLVPTRRQAIIWTNDGLSYWRIYASLGLNELMRDDAIKGIVHQQSCLDCQPVGVYSVCNQPDECRKILPTNLVHHRHLQLKEVHRSHHPDNCKLRNQAVAHNDANRQIHVYDNWSSERSSLYGCLICGILNTIFF